MALFPKYCHIFLPWRPKRKGTRPGITSAGPMGKDRGDQEQTGGGPIGIRGTCAVARLLMQLIDRKWGEILREMGVTVWDSVRYMDDLRTILPPFKPGWRWADGGIKFCRKWEGENMGISPTERTRRIIAGTMRGVEDS